MFTGEITVNPKYKYIDNDISRILGIRLHQENLRESNNIFKVAPIGETENTLVTFLNEETTNHVSFPNRTVLIPYLIGDDNDGHWVGVVVKFENNLVTRVEYYDSLVRSITSKLVQDLKRVYCNDLENKIDTIQGNFITQDDCASCGPCMIENLVNAAKQDHHISPISEIRKHHIFLMNNDPDGQDFYERQQNNQSFVSRSQDPKTTNESSNENKLSGMSYVVAPKKQDDVSDDDKNEYYFPRCEYKFRFKDTSAFSMLDPNYWNTYFRSTSQGGNCDRIAKLVKSNKTYKNSNINKLSDKQHIPPAKSGCIKSPWVHDQYKAILYSQPFSPKKVNKNNATCLYDQMLQYKLSICSIVVSSFVALRIPDRKIDVYFTNDYPCILVQIKDFAVLFDPHQEQGSLYKIVMAYFTAITNIYAYKYKIPIEIVNRASFGHNIPSVSDTSKSFRINIGIVPKSYATKVLAKSLKSLNNKFLVPLLNKDPKTKMDKLGFSKDMITHHNDTVNCYNNKKGTTKKQASNVELWQQEDSLWTVLCKVGDSSGRKVSYQITRCNQYIDLLANYAHQYFFVKKPSAAFAQPFLPLRKILKQLTYQDQRAILSINHQDYNNKLFEFQNDESPELKDDEKLWEIIQNISFVLGTNILSNTINSKKVKGLYSLLEKANLAFIRNSNNKQAEDGYGSSSDCEVTVDGTDFYSRKITVATGMRAINLVHFLSICQARSQRVDTDYMYYETGDVIHSLVQDLKQSRNLDLATQSGIVKYIDLNHCAAGGDNAKVDLQKINNTLHSAAVIVLDYTSATTEKISEAIRLFIKKVPIILLISSGIKNEQVGADMNPYGTLRIIATDSKDLNKLYYILKANLITQERLPQELHNIRKGYKNAGTVITSPAIYTKARGYDFQLKTDEDDSNVMDFSENSPTLPGELKKICCLFSSEYEEAYNNLTDTHAMSFISIIEWDLKKIKFLGSDDIVFVKEKLGDDPDIFHQIEDLYNDDDGMAYDIVRDILESEEDLTNLDFLELAKAYEDYDDDNNLKGENKIDIIAGQMNYDPEYYRIGFAFAKLNGMIDSDWSTPRSSDADGSPMGSYDDSSSAGSSDDDDNILSLGESMDYE